MDHDTAVCTGHGHMSKSSDMGYANTVHRDHRVCPYGLCDDMAVIEHGVILALLMMTCLTIA